MQVIYFTINFILFVFFMFLLLRKPISKFLKDRKDAYVNGHTEAKTFYDDAFNKLNEIKHKTSNIAKDGKANLEQAIKQAKTEGDIIVVNAEGYSKNILVGSKDVIREEVERAKNKQVTSFVQSVIANTKKSVKDESASKDYNGIYIEDYFSKTKESNA
jgi:F0F1-type ATP synthase membrane subunit b/b'